nr:hypothetical protein GCM10020185_83410 [Pseudomonas brassicacearum subsp. brassicacearum]
MLFHSLLHEDSGVYLMQDRYRIGGAIDEGAFLESWRQVVALHPSLRASFQWKSQKQPVQVIHRQVKVPLDTLDLRGLAPMSRKRESARCWKTSRKSASTCRSHR